MLPSERACSSKTRMNSSPIALRFSSGSVTPARRARKRSRASTWIERDVEVAAEGLHDLRGLVLAQEPVVDEDAGELVADGLVHEQRGHGGVDPAGERAEHALAPHLRADARGLLLDHRRGRPRRRRLGDPVEEVLEDLRPVLGVQHLRVELDPVEAARRILEAADRRRGRLGGDARTVGRCGDGVAVAHPADLLGGEAAEEGAVGIDADIRPPELRAVGALDPAAEVPGHELHPVTDAEHGHAELEDPRIGQRRALGVDRGGPAREDERKRPPGGDRRRRGRVVDELRVDAALPDAPRDQLRVLAAEVDDEDGALFRRRLLERERDDLAH